MTFEGMTVEQAAAQLGKSISDATRWLRDKGYRYVYSGPRVLYRVRGAQEVADEVNARIQAMRPVAPCFRCGAREGCSHR